MVVEAFVFGAPVVMVMVGVPIWHSIGACRNGRTAKLRLLRWWLVCVVIVSISMVTGLAFGVAGFVLSNLPSAAPKASQISTVCKIVSSGIDLRSSKICTPRYYSNTRDNLIMRSKFRCYFDYYWASVFKVEFKQLPSELPLEAVSEVPNEALPAYCRPGFGPIWILKEHYKVWMSKLLTVPLSSCLVERDKYFRVGLYGMWRVACGVLQVNQTYPCKYSPGSPEIVDMAGDLFADCKPEKITVLQLIKQACVVLFCSEQWIFSSTSQAGRVFRKALSSISFAACYSVLVMAFSKTVSQLRFMLFGPNYFGGAEKVYFEARLQITCVLLGILVATVWGTMVTWRVWTSS